MTGDQVATGAERPAAGAGLPEKPDVFISYSRKDKDRVSAILAPLREAGLELWFDVEDIPLSADWKHEIDRGIAAAPTMLFMLSDRSLGSVHCTDEVETAVEYGKRIVPVALETPTGSVPEALSRPNWIPAEDRAAEAVAADIHETINTDLEWAEFHTRLLERALEWDAQERNGSLVLRGSDLARARAEVAEAHDAEPVVTALQREYVAQSVAAQTRRRVLGSVVGVALALITIAAVIAVFQWRRADASERVAESLRLASDGSLLYDDQLDLGLLLSLEGVATDLNQEVQSALIRGVTGGPGLRRVETPSDSPLESAQFDGSGTVAAVVDTNNRAFLWRPGEPAPVSIAVDRVAAAAISNDGSTAVLGTTGSVVIIDTSTGDVEAVCGSEGLVEVVATGTQARISAIVVRGSGGTRLAAITRDCGDVFGSVPIESPTSVAIAEADDVIASGSTTDGLVLWQASSGLPFSALPGAAEIAVRSVALSPDGELVAAGTDDGDIFIWATRVAEPPVRTIGGHNDWVTTLAFDATSSRLLSGSLDGSVREWNVATGEPAVPPLMSFPPDRSITTIVAVSFGAGGRAHSLHGEGRALDWDLAGRSPLATRSSRQVGVTSIDVTGNTLAVGSGAGLELVPTGPDAGPSTSVYGEPVRSVAFVEEEPEIVLGLDSGERVVVGRDGAVVHGPFPGPASGSERDRRALSVAASTSGSIIASGHQDGSVRIIDLGDESERELTHGPGYVSEVRFADADQLLLSAGEDGTVKVWSLESDDEVLAFSGHRATVDALAVHPVEPVAASGSDDRTILIWDYRTGEVVQQLSGHTDRVVSVAFSPAGDRLVSSSEDATVIVWDLATGAVIGQPLRNEFEAQADSVVFDAASSTVVFAGGSGVHRWDLTPAVVERAACSIAGTRTFTTSEADRYLGGEDPRYDCAAAR